MLNDGFSPTERERADARAVLEAYRAAEGAGPGASGIDGRRIDLQAVGRAQRLIDVSRRIEAREARKRLGGGRPNPWDEAAQHARGDRVALV